MKTLSGLLLAAASCVAISLTTPQEAHACGGTFPPPPTLEAMPVDQTGENILFVMGEGFVEAHIQIQYDPDTKATEFAWVVPVAVVPEFSVGSQSLFNNILAGSVPTYAVFTQFDNCNPGGSSMSSSAVSSDATTNGSTTTTTSGTGGESGGPDIVFEDTVGAFDIAVLSGGTAAEVMQWLSDNAYHPDPNAEPILNEYLQEEFLFAAFKLTNGAGLDAIHPVTLRFPDSEEACVPLRLTRIAAQDDMDVRTFFLADDRVVPRSYRHVLVNPLKIDWVNFAANYRDVIRQAVDAPEADGKAFVTEYAGVSSVVSQEGILQPAWDAAPFPNIDPILVVDELEAQGIVDCYGNQFCDFEHPLVRGLLQQFLPAPDGVGAEEFWGCLSCFEAMIDLVAWDGDAFATAYQQRIIDPAAHAIDLLETWPYLTRMYTTISPGEMTEDPFFHVNPDLPTVFWRRLAYQRVLCSFDSVYALPDGREVFVPRASSWPGFPDEMPWEEDVEEVPAAGPGINLADNTDRINELLAEWNAQHGWPFDEDDGGQPGSGSTSDADTDSGGDGDGTSTGSNGCGCRASGVGAMGTVVFGGLFGLWAGAVRRRRRV